MSTAAPNPNKTLLLAMLGIGAFWFMTRRATAQPMPIRTGTQQGSGASTANAIGNIVNGLGRIFGGSGSGSGTGSQGSAGAGRVSEIFNDDVPGQPGYGWKYYTDGTAIGPDGTYYQGDKAIWSPSSDQIAYNPPGNQDVYGALNEYQG